MKHVWEHRYYEGEPNYKGEGIVHAADDDSIDRKAACGKYVDWSGFFRVPDHSMVTCLQCLTRMG